MFELLLTCGLLLAVAGLTVTLREFVPRFHHVTVCPAAVHASADAELYGNNLVETYLAYRQ